MIVLDKWQKEFIEYKSHKILVAGRQTGKSEAQAYDNAEFAAKYPGTTCMIISKTQRQSDELLIKTLNYLQQNYPGRIGKGKHKPLKHSVWITHKGGKPSRVMCQPTGLAGEGIRSYTIHKLSVDEAQLVEDEVFTSVTPMLLTTGGSISLTGTPRGRKGYFWQSFENKLGHFKVFHVNSKEVIENRPISESWPIWRKEAALKHLEQEKQRMTAKQFSQEYEGAFVEDLDSVFPEDLIKACCTLKPNSEKTSKMYLGVDIGRVEDPSTFEIVADEGALFVHKQNIVLKELSIPQNAQKIKDLYNTYRFRQMGIDGGGLGSGVVDILMLDRSLQEKVKDLNNSQRIIAVDDDREKKRSLLKEQMYFNLQSLMHQKKILLLDDEELKASLRSCQMEFMENSDDVKIYGVDTHITEGLIRAVWLAQKGKTLNLWAA